MQTFLERQILNCLNGDPRLILGAQKGLNILLNLTYDDTRTCCSGERCDLLAYYICQFVFPEM